LVAPLVEVRNLVKHFERGGGLFREKSVVKAVDNVSFSVNEGETFALVGESGSGKSTTGRCMLRLIEPTSGEVTFKGANVLGFSSAEMRTARRDMQMVFQDPYSSLNPRMRASTIVEEPLIIHRIGSKAERRDRVAELFRLVGLDPAHLDRFPHEFSGGQRQRIGLARALALNPSFIIADEPVSALTRILGPCCRPCRRRIRTRRGRGSSSIPRSSTATRRCDRWRMDTSPRPESGDLASW
jgi:oligopeptide transport system ATP-binding protein